MYLTAQEWHLPADELCVRSTPSCTSRPLHVPRTGGDCEDPHAWASRGRNQEGVCSYQKTLMIVQFTVFLYLILNCHCSRWYRCTVTWSPMKTLLKLMWVCHSFSVLVFRTQYLSKAEIFSQEQFQVNLVMQIHYSWYVWILWNISL